MGNYVSPDILKQSAEQDEHSPSNIWDTLAEAVSRMFDKESEVENDFFAKAPATGTTTKTVRANGTEFVQLFPYIAGSITAITIDGVAVTVPTTNNEFYESEGYLVFASNIRKGAVISVTARYGFPSIPGDIVQACLEQAIFMWRRKDLAFADLSGVPTAAVVAEFSPTFTAATKRYRGLYGQQNYFA